VNEVYFTSAIDSLVYVGRLALPLHNHGRTDGHVTITSQPKFLGLIGYHISLAMELRWRALPAGSANKPDSIIEKPYPSRQHKQ